MIRLVGVAPTHLVREEGGVLTHRLRFSIQNDGEAETVQVAVEAGERSWHASCRVEKGESVHDLSVAALESTVAAAALLTHADGRRERLPIELSPPRRFVVHVVQSSHHDVGYTNLASTVLGEHARWLAEALHMARDTDSYPPEARFRVVIEQAWSLLEFLKRSGDEQTRDMEARLRQGRFELTALFGNMVTELCGHETLIRALYPSFSLARRFGIPLVSAEHNDVPGISWGLSRVLTDAGISLFCPAIPQYYRWGGLDLPAHWNEKAIFGREGPGAFWWQAPSGRKLLFFCNNGRASGEGFASELTLGRELTNMAAAGYPFSVVRWPVGGARRDNAPFTSGFCDSVRVWNRAWLSPRLEISTNARFYQRLAPELPADLPVHRGELPGQDYPVGSTSTATATAANRGNHARLPAAEILSSAAALWTDFRYPESAIRDAFEEVLWHDEHTWGHHFPAGPTARAAAMEKAVHAYRAEAITHDVASKAMARIADAISAPRPEGAHRLVVFNSLPHERDGIVSAPLRELDNCGSEIVAEIDERTGAETRRGVVLTDRWHVNLDPLCCRGEMRLLDEERNEEISFDVVAIADGMTPVPFAAERKGLGSGTRRYGLFEDPVGIRRDLVFRAQGVPACGYRSYLLIPEPGRGREASTPSPQTRVIQNERYRIEAAAGGGVVSIRDLSSGRELLDGACGHGFLQAVVRLPREGEPWRAGPFTRCEITCGAVSSTLTLEATAPGHPLIRHAITLYRGRPEIHVATRVLKSPEPLLDFALCFPFAAEDARFSFEGVLCTLRPVEDFLAGAASDDLAVQNWVRVQDDDHALLWTSLDAPVAQLGALRSGAVSPAHRAVFDPAVAHAPLDREAYRAGCIYAHLYANNFGTNFLASQSGDTLFRFVIAPAPSGASAGDAVLQAQEAVTPLQSILGAGRTGGTLSPTGSFLRLDPPDLVLLTWKRAEVGPGHTLRLWNPHQHAVSSLLTLAGRRVSAAALANAAEEPTGEQLLLESGAIRIEAPPDTVLTVLVQENVSDAP